MSELYKYHAIFK